MGEFFQKHSYLVLWVSSLVIVGSLAMVILALNGYVPSLPSLPNILNQAPAAPPPTATSGTVPATTPAPAKPAAPPSVTISIIKTPSGNSIFVQWQNLPDGTLALNIYRGKTGTNQSTWSLWKTISLAGQDISNGNYEISIGSSTEYGYSFSVQAIGNGTQNGTSSASGTPGQTVLWQSPPTVPVVTTSTPSLTPENPPPQNPTGTPQAPPAGSGPNPPATPSGTPYYNPEVQIETYGSGQSGNFWVQYVDQKIEIGWQNLPQDTTGITVARSSNQDGPWTTVLTQHNPGTAGANSLQLVDNTVNIPYYYELVASVGASASTTYGPEYLPAQ